MILITIFFPLKFKNKMKLHKKIMGNLQDTAQFSNGIPRPPYTWPEK